MGPIKRFKVANFKGIVVMEIQPDGRSVVFAGPNGSGKSSMLDALFWGLGGNLDEEIVRNSADKAQVTVQYEGYIVERSKKRGGKPTIKVKDSEGRTYASPTELMRGFAAALERKTFSRLTPKERIATLLKLCPSLDTSKLDAERAKLYAERTEHNRRVRDLEGEIAGMKPIIAPEDAGEEVSIALAVKQHQEAVAVKARNDKTRAEAKRIAELQEQARANVEAAKAALEQAASQERDLANARAEADKVVASLKDPDVAAIAAQIDQAEEINARVREAKALQERAAEGGRARKAKQERCDAEKQESDKRTRRIEEIDAEKLAAVADAKLPIAGLAIGDGEATFDDGEHGPVEIPGLNSATKIRLDIAIGASLGYRLVPVPEASLLDSEKLAEMEADAAARGVQLFAERVLDPAAGGSRVLIATIEEGSPTPPAEVSQEALKFGE